MITKLRAILLFLLMVVTACPAAPSKPPPPQIDQTQELFMALARMTLDSSDKTAGFWGIGHFWKKHKKEVIAVAVVAVMVTAAIISGKKK